MKFLLLEQEIHRRYVDVIGNTILVLSTLFTQVHERHITT